MGAWGYRYNQNDDHYNEGNAIFEAALDKLHESGFLAGRTLRLLDTIKGNTG